MPQGLPSGWIKTTLGNVCAINPSTRLDPVMPNDTEVSFIPMVAVEEETGRLDASQVRTLASVRTRYRPFRENDVLFAKITPCMENGKIALASGLKNGLGYGSTEFMVFRPFKGVIPRFVLYYLLRASFRREAQRHMTGVVGQKRVPRGYLASREILLPPVAEQARIVTKLEAALLRLERAERAARRSQVRLDRYRVAVLNAAVSGRLTSEWREAQHLNQSPTEKGTRLLTDIVAARRTRWEESQLQRFRGMHRLPKDDRWKSRYAAPSPPARDNLPPLPDDWAWASIDQLSWAAGYGTSAKCTYRAIGAAILRIPNIRNRVIDLRDLKFASDNTPLRPWNFVSPGDLLIIRTNGSRTLVGRAAVVKAPLDQECGFASYLIRFRLLGPEILWSWVSLVWSSDTVRSALQSRAKTTAGQYNLSLSALRTVALPLPPVAEQRQIVGRAEARLAAADQLASKIETQLGRTRTARGLLLDDAFAGGLVDQDPRDQHASAILSEIERDVFQSNRSKATPRRDRRGGPNKVRRAPMKEARIGSEELVAAFHRIGKSADALRLFVESGYTPDRVTEFYETLRDTPQVRAAFEAVSLASPDGATVRSVGDVPTPALARFRLSELWLRDFKNLRDYTVRFDTAHGLDILLGWNGTGKSNLLESLVIIFRDLYEWTERNRWPDEPMAAYRIRYELDDELIQVTWDPEEMKRPVATTACRSPGAATFSTANPVGRTELRLPRFIFGYYSGPTNRLAEHFLPMKQAHYVRLRKAPSDDEETLAQLLEQRRFFCAETHHAKYVLLAFSYREDRRISDFLRKRLRIDRFESALFVIRRPRWAKRSAAADDFWGATGIMRRVMERLRRNSIASMILSQTVTEGYQTKNEDHYYFFIPDLQSLHSFAAEYPDARTFFLALESTDFSELIHDVKIQVRIRASNAEDAKITFHQMSEGEQQLLMVLGLMRFTKSHQSLVLLDEPDTHLNPQWSADYIKDLTSVVGDGDREAPEQHTSQLLLATHDPLVIAGLLRDQIHIMTRDRKSGLCTWTQPSESPRGLGVSGILMSDAFGFRSDLDEETLADLDARVRLVGRASVLTESDKQTLQEIDRRLAGARVPSAYSDPYYAAFLRAWGRRHAHLVAGRKSLTREDWEEVERVAAEVLKEAAKEVEEEFGEGGQK